MIATVLKKMTGWVVFVLFVGMFMIISGCAAKATRMIPTEYEIINRHAVTVTVGETIGGIETNPLWTSQISNGAFTEALKNALIKSEIFECVSQGADADYMLDTTILDYNKPVIGGDYDITIKTLWELTDTKTLLPVWSETFASTYKAKLSEELVAAKRLQRANEGAVRVNIKEGIRRLSLLNLKK